MSWLVLVLCLRQHSWERESERERDSNSHMMHSNRGMKRHRNSASLLLHEGKHGNTIVPVHIRSTLTRIISKDVQVASLFLRKAENTIITSDRRERSALRNQVIRSFTSCVFYRTVRSTCSLGVVLSSCFVAWPWNIKHDWYPMRRVEWESHASEWARQLSEVECSHQPQHESCSERRRSNWRRFWQLPGRHADGQDTSREVWHRHFEFRSKGMSCWVSLSVRFDHGRSRAKWKRRAPPARDEWQWDQWSGNVQLTSPCVETVRIVRDHTSVTKQLCQERSEEEATRRIDVETNDHDFFYLPRFWETALLQFVIIRKNQWANICFT